MTTTTNNNVNEEERNTSDSPVVEALRDYFVKAGFVQLQREDDLNLGLACQ